MSRNVLLNENEFSCVEFYLDRRGAALAEFAIVLPVLALIVAMTTDVGLAALAQQQVRNAARAGAEYAANVGYNATGIQIAGQRALQNAAGSMTARLISEPVVTPSVGCGCASAGSIIYSSDPTAPACNSSSLCDNNTAARPFARIVATASYKPIFSFYWSGLSNGLLTMTHTVVVRTSAG